MKKTVDLKMPEVMELGREELKKVDGGFTPVLIVDFSLFLTGLIVGYKKNNYKPE